MFPSDDLFSTVTELIQVVIQEIYVRRITVDTDLIFQNIKSFSGEIRSQDPRINICINSVTVKSLLSLEKIYRYTLSQNKNWRQEMF